jgi:hypothetical protein
MIGFINTFLVHSLLITNNTTRTYKWYSTIADLHTFQFSAAHVPRFSVSTIRWLVADLNTGTIASDNYEVFLSFLLHSPWNAEPNSPIWILQSLYCIVLTGTQLISSISFHFSLSASWQRIYNILTVNKSSNHTLRQLRTSHGYLLPPTELEIILGTSLYSHGMDTHHRKHVTWPVLLCDITVHALYGSGPCADMKRTLPRYCCMARVCVGTCLLSRCLAMRWSNPLQYVLWNTGWYTKSKIQ